MASCHASLLVVMLLLASSALVAQPRPPEPGGPPPPRPEPVERRMVDIRNRLAASPPSDADQRELARFVLEYLNDAVQALNAGRWFQADRFADAADACRRPINHLRHVAAIDRRPRPPLDPEDQLRQVYFRLRLGDFFLQQIPMRPPKRLLELARMYYQRALKAEQDRDRHTADEYAKAADDLTHALESLAQAYVPDRPGNPPQP
jgi:hypothetical protein